MGNTEPVRSCLHCLVPLVNERPWPGLGFLADCPVCTSSFLRRYQPAVVREEVLIAAEQVAFERGRTGNLERWSRAWNIVADAYLREGDTASAARCLDNSLTLFRWKNGSEAQAVCS